MKHEFDSDRLWINAYSNDVSTYIVSKRLLKEGGYEVNNSLSATVSYGKPERVQPAVEDRIVNHVRTLLPAKFCNVPETSSNADSNGFSVVLLPDTQFYSKSHPETYVSQTRWIRDQVEDHNIKFVIHLGDIVDSHNDVEDEWRNADRAHQLLDGATPYSVLPGNHDMGKEDGRITDDTSLYNKYFGPHRFAGCSWYGGHLRDVNDNNYCLFEAAGMSFLVVSLEYSPDSETLNWANKVIAAHPDHRVILATHCYMRPKGRDKSIGERLWNQCVRKHKNVFLVVSGHVLGVGRQTSRSDAGAPVHELLVDYQGLPNGGNGWLSVLRFAPRENKIFVKAFSPLLDKTNDEPDHTYSLDYDMTSGARRKAG